MKKDYCVRKAFENLRWESERLQEQEQRWEYEKTVRPTCREYIRLGDSIVRGIIMFYIKVLPHTTVQR